MADSVQANNAALFQNPNANRAHIVFVCAGNASIGPRSADDARQLTGTGIKTETVNL